MDRSELYHAGNRLFQDRFDSRRIADRLEEARMHREFSENDRKVIESAPFFFLATAAAGGSLDCSYKGGMPGFVRVISANTLAFPHYDGHGMFKSLGNILQNPQVGLLFLQFDGDMLRVRISGTAAVSHDDPLIAEFEGAQSLVRVTARHIFPNCPRYIHRMELKELSAYSPKAGYIPPQPLWKSKPDLKDYLPRKK